MTWGAIINVVDGNSGPMLRGEQPKRDRGMMRLKSSLQHGLIGTRDPTFARL